MLGAGAIKQEVPEIKQEPQDHDEFTPNIFVKTEEQPGTSTGPYYSRPLNTKVTYKVKSMTAGQVPLRKVARLEGMVKEEPVEKTETPVDPWYYKIPVYRRRTRDTRAPRTKSAPGQPLRRVTPRFVPNPGLKSQEELEKLMNELEEAQKKDKPPPLQEYPCPIPGCIALFTSAMGLSRHKALHREIFKCGECLQVFKEKDELKAHIRVHEGVDPPSAIVKAQAIPRTMKLIQSKARQEPSRPKEHTANTDDLLAEIARRKVFICGTGCGQSFKTKSELQRHMVTHDADMKDSGLVRPKEEADK